MAPKQKQALFTLIWFTWVYGIPCSFLVTALFHVPTWVQIVILIVLVAAAPFAVYSGWRLLTRQDADEYERDRVIMSKASKYPNLATVFALGIWMIVFAVSYGDNDEVPSWLVAAVIGSVALVNLMAQPLGVLIAYWLANRQVTKP
jgi:amino acid permease